MTHQDKKIIIEGETIAPEISEEKLQEIRVRIGTLLKMESVSFLLGAGASAECGGPLLGSIPIEIEERLLN
ncbi:MAG: hypothetical protein NZM37_06690 [Sandaracinaceae bacterium]|nr:hypothetical protein [Sandaracinaceae bacterium]MDW8245145.1 hypothetical protein [Sandaracinaceae bacterium]